MIANSLKGSAGWWQGSPVIMPPAPALPAWLRIIFLTRHGGGQMQSVLYATLDMPNFLARHGGGQDKNDIAHQARAAFGCMKIR